MLKSLKNLNLIFLLPSIIVCGASIVGIFAAVPKLIIKNFPL